MSLPRSPFDSPEDLPGGKAEAFIARVIADSHAAPNMDPAWVQRLSQNLEREFAASAGAGSHDSLATLIGMKQRGWTESDADTTSWPTEKSFREALMARNPRRSSLGLRRWGTVAAAAALLVTAGIWSMQPRYTWSGTLAAMSQQPWIQADCTTRTGAQSVHWLAPTLRLAASKTGRVLRVIDGIRGSEHWCFVGENKVHQAALPRRWNPTDDLAREVASFLLIGDTSLTQVILGEDGAVRIVEESWRAIPGDTEQVELNVSISRANASVVQVKLLVDASTQLPSSGKVTDMPLEPTETPPHVEFSYPATGPSSLEDLGAPAVAPRAPGDPSPQTDRLAMHRPISPASR